MSEETILEHLEQQDKKLEAIHAQVLATNGRVSELEKWRIRLDAVSDYKSSHPTVKNAENVTVNTSVWNDPKLVIALLGFLSAATAYLIWLTQKGGA